jgi:hypothetical protein
MTRTKRIAEKFNKLLRAVNPEGLGAIAQCEVEASARLDGNVAKKTSS